MATAAYIAEHSMVNGATFSEVELYIPNPWGDMPPTNDKNSQQKFISPQTHVVLRRQSLRSIFIANRAGNLADIEYNVLVKDLLSDKIADLTGKRMAVAEREARLRVIRSINTNYLPSGNPLMILGLRDKNTVGGTLKSFMVLMLTIQCLR